MKRILLTAVPFLSLAMVDMNLGVHSNVASDAVQLGIDYSSETSYRFGQHYYKAGYVVSLGGGLTTANPYVYTNLGFLYKFGPNHQVKLGLQSKVLSEVENVYFFTRDGFFAQYQRRLQQFGNYWVGVELQWVPEVSEVFSRIEKTTEGRWENNEYISPEYEVITETNVLRPSKTVCSLGIGRTLYDYR